MSGIAASVGDKCCLTQSEGFWEEVRVMNSSSPSRGKLDRGSSIVFLEVAIISELFDWDVQ